MSVVSEPKPTFDSFVLFRIRQSRSVLSNGRLWPKDGRSLLLNEVMFDGCCFAYYKGF